jgi:hypothetical protein
MMFTKIYQLEAKDRRDSIDCYGHGEQGHKWIVELREWKVCVALW